MYRKYFKRPLDLFVATIILLSTSPFFLITWLFLMLQNKGKAFFFQERPGYSALPFNIIKFKTMNDRKGLGGKLLPDNQRLTLFGKYVRKMSLDELPQLINVLKGDMSLIGPRPLLMRYLEIYSKEQMRRHDVRPGITGWAQVNGRNAISWQKKFELDIQYVDQADFKMDLQIFWLTIMNILKSEGINQSTDRPMEPFNGTN
jgi:undecaprenyl phosphate N,N'-diacetylbacillosamine 1-phosphate transferase